MISKLIMVKIGTDLTIRDKMKITIDKILADLIEKIKIFIPYANEMALCDSYYQKLYDLVLSLDNMYRNIDVKIILQCNNIRKDFLRDTDNILEYLLIISNGNAMLLSCENFKNIVIYLDYLMCQLIEYHKQLIIIDEDNRNSEPVDLTINFM